jgi:hypothetical protein
MALHGVFCEAYEMGSFELSGKLIKRHSLALPTDLEQTQHDLALTLLYDFDREFFAGGLGRFLMLLTVHRVAHPPES